MVLPFQQPVPSPRVPIGQPMGGMGMPGMMPPAPLMGGMAPSQQPATDPMALMEALRGLVGNVTPPPEPIYPGNYTRPKKLDEKKAYELGRKRRDDYLVRNWLYDKIIKQLRLQLVGVFPEDEEDRRNGFQEEFISIELVNEFNLAVSFLAGLAYTVDKQVIDPTKRADAQMLEDALFWLRDEDRYRYAERGNGPLATDEAKLLLGYGTIIGRDVMDLRRPEFPFRSVLLDPATVYPEWWGDQGLGRCWQIMRTTTARVLGDYDPPARIAKLVRGQFGSDDHDECDFTDFWDTWHHIAWAGDIVLHDQDHEYGYVPITIQHGPLGDAMLTTAPGEIPVRTHNGILVSSETRWQDDLSHKALPYIFFLAKAHEQFEALMARILTGVKKEINPPLILARSNNISGEERPQFETGPGAVNEISLEDEKLTGFPTISNMAAIQTALQAVVADRQSGGLVSLVGGQRVQSNVTGVAANTFQDQGYDRLDPWKQALESFHAHRATKRLISWRNFGHLAAYQQGKPTQRLAIPRRRPTQGEAPAFELTPDLIDRVGPRVQVTLTRINPAQWLPIANVMQQLDGIDMLDPRFFAPYLGITDIDRYLDEAREAKTMRQIANHPKFVEIKLAVDTFLAEIKETGDPIRREQLIDQLEMWLQVISGPAAAPPPPPMNGMGGPGAPPPGPQNPPTSAGVSYPALGQPPGMTQGVTGRPAGLM